MSASDQLKALSRLRPWDGLKPMDYDDLQRWLRRAGPNYDASVLCDLDRERIDSIFSSFYQT